MIDEHIGLDVKIDENLLDLYEVRSRNFGDMLQGIFNRMSKKFEKALYIRHWLVEEYVRIETDSIVAYQADGEYHR